MIPRKNLRKQAISASLVPVAPDNDPAPYPGSGPARCPCCHRPWFDPRTSGLLDMVLLAKDVLSDIQRCVEEEVLP